MPDTLETHIRQFFAYATLDRLDRIEDAGIGFTFRTHELYLSAFAEAVDGLEEALDHESTSGLLRYAQVFERFAAVHPEGVNQSAAALTAAAFYWVAGYGANAGVLARAVERRDKRPRALRLDTPTGLLAATLSRSVFTAAAAARAPIAVQLRRFVETGDEYSLATALAAVDRERRGYLAACAVDEYAASVLLDASLRRLSRTSLWRSLADNTSATKSAWRRYARSRSRAGAPVVDLWPSQRSAIRKGLLDGHSSLVLRMPTSAGKTKLTELAFVNDLATDSRRCLYLAPFRALVSDVEAALAPALTSIGISVASLYGGSDANELEVQLSQEARVVIATPEKIAAVLRLGGGSLADFGTVVIDEGHLIGEGARGAMFELQLAALLAEAETRAQEGRSTPRIIFLSAVLPNAAALAGWLSGSTDALADDPWRPTVTRVAELTWGKRRYAQLDYRLLPGHNELKFFVPRVLEEDSWSEVWPATGRKRLHRFPDKRDQGSIAAALALRLLGQGPVLLFVRRPDWADGVATRILDRLELARPIDTSLVDGNNREALRSLSQFIAARLGAESLLARSVAVGVGIHHGKIPQSLRHIIEDAFRERVLRILIATSTVAQGVNFPTRTVIMHSLPHGHAPVRTFWNLAGRAGRATKETEGELIILRTGDLREQTLARFLNRNNTEPAASQVLKLVRDVLARGPTLSEEAIAALSGGLQPDGWPVDDDDVKEYRRTLGAVDTTLLEHMVEDVDGADEGVVERLARHLFATHQASDSTETEEVRNGISELLRLRAAAVRSIAPDAVTRRRFARSGLSASDAAVLDGVLPSVRAAIAVSPTLNEEGLRGVIEAACNAPEMEGNDPTTTALLTYTWITTGRYDSVMAAIPDLFETLEEAIAYAEETFTYRLSWVLNGLVRLLQPADGESPATAANGGGTVTTEATPEWVRYLPQYVRYGVSTPEMLWAMTLGVQDRGYAAFLLERFAEDERRAPAGFRDLLRWLLRQRDDLLSRTRDGWPAYFARIIQEVTERYSSMESMLGTTTEGG